MPWSDTTTINDYHSFVQTYISNYASKIDCADLAIAALVDFASARKLPLKIKYYSSGWKWYTYNPDTDNAIVFKNNTMKMLGALNVIDNTNPVPIGMARPGDLIMSKWDNSRGHTRIIHTIDYDPQSKKYTVTWYQGNIPPVKPEGEKEDFFKIKGVYGGTPRRWNFEQFFEWPKGTKEGWRPNQGFGR